MRGDVALGDVPDVLTVVAALRERRRPAAQLLDPRLHAARQAQNLRAAVVVVELARHAPARPLEQRRDRVAQGRLAAMADVQRTGGIGGDELDVRGPAPPSVAPAVPLAGGQHGREHARQLRLGQEEVDEAGPRDLHLFHITGGELERADQLVGDGTRRLPQTLREERSEEHTSELQSLAYLVCRLLLEKKKKTKKHHQRTVSISRK